MFYKRYRIGKRTRCAIRKAHNRNPLDVKSQGFNQAYEIKEEYTIGSNGTYH
jgi:hypothetical protein